MVGWTEAEKAFFDNWKEYQFDADPYKYRQKPKEISTYDELVAAGVIKPKRKRKNRRKKLNGIDEKNK